MSGDRGSRDSSTTLPAAPSQPPSSSAALEAPLVLLGIAGSPGVAVGPALVVGDLKLQVVHKHLHAPQVDDEIARVKAAVRLAQDTLRDVSAKMGASRETALILEAYLLMLEDPMLLDRVEQKIRVEKKNGEWAVAEASDEIVAAFGTPEIRDAYIVERRHDVEFVCDRLLRALLGDAAPAPLRLDEPTIVVARDLSPADTAGMVREPVLAFITEVGSRTSHTAIMARALEIPAVVGATDALKRIRTGDTLVVDGLTGTVIVHPGAVDVRDAKLRSRRHIAFAKRLLEAKDRPGATACGERVALKANVELPAEAILAVDHGAEGIGLYRTEFLYIDRATMPTEDEQYGIYRAVVEAVGHRPVTLRTFDIGGDKFASSFQLPAEMNPALGLRAVRLALKQPDVFLTQLRAMVRASAHGDLRIMVPMVTTLPELRAARELFRRAVSEVRAAGHACREDIPFGMMIEVPSAAIMADAFAREAAFFSLGTNDLVQYALAVDRTSQSLAELASPLDPSILRLVHAATRAAIAQRIPISICGAMASDPLAACLLVGLGLRDLSMEAAAIPEIKAALARVTVAEAETVAEASLSCDSAERVKELLQEAFGPRLSDLLSGFGDDP